MNTIDLTTLIPRVHEAARANGWWDTPRNAGEALMLVVSELSEALEADRSGKQATMHPNHVKHMLVAMSDPQDAAREFFKNEIKDTVGDELADAYIRLCDFAGGFEVATPEWIAGYASDLRRRIKAAYVAGNFGEALLRITLSVGAIEGDFMPINLAASLVRLEALCAKMGIDLATHIDLKLTYNATRGIRHGGKAY